MTQYYPHNSASLRVKVYCTSCGVNTGDWVTKLKAIRVWNLRKPIGRIEDKLKKMKQCAAEAHEIASEGHKWSEIKYEKGRMCALDDVEQMIVEEVGT